MKRYLQLAKEIYKNIEKGELDPGSRLPSIRTLSQQYQLSKNTVIRALRELEDQKLIQANPRQGFVVSAAHKTSPMLQPRKVTMGSTAFSVLGAANKPGNLALGSAYPDARWPTVRWFYQQQAKTARLWALENSRRRSHYSTPPGDPDLRKALADYLNTSTFSCNSEEIVITQGTQEAVSLCLRAVAQPGDTIAVESPCYYGTLQCIEALGLKVLELPSDPILGTNLDALESGLKQWPIKAVLTNPSFNNPYGFNLDLNSRKRLIDISNRWDIAIIEDDVAGELSYNLQRPTPLKALDTEQRVLYCASFSKTMDVDLRIGWVLPGRYYDQINYLKFVTSIACPALAQQTLTELLKGRRYRRHLNLINRAYSERAEQLAEDTRKYWPKDTLFITPKGGILQWFQLPVQVDSDLLFQQALEASIGISPGNLFCTDQRFGHHIRLCYAHYTQTPEQTAAIKQLGEMMEKF